MDTRSLNTLNSSVLDFEAYPKSPEGWDIHVKEAGSKETLRMSMGAFKPAPPELPGREPWKVDFDVRDPLCAKNWSQRKKVIMGLLLGYSAIVCGWGSSVFSAAVEDVAQKFDKSTNLVNLGTSVYIAGFASGPLLWGPMSEVYGRRRPIIISTLGCALFNTLTGVSSNFQSVVLFRFFAGFIGAAPVSITSGAFADMFGSEGRGKAMIAFTSSIFIVPILAPIAGSYIAHSSLGWRWVQYITGIMGAVAGVLLLVFLKESFGPLLLCEKARKLRRATGNWGIYSPYEESDWTLIELLKKTISKPLIMLWYEPILLLMSIYTAFVYGMFYLYLEAYPVVFKDGYKLSDTKSTLPYLGLAIGMLIGTLLLYYVFERRYKKSSRSPRDRLPPSIIGGIIFPVGIFWLTWSGNYPDKVHWIVPTTSGLFTGTGTILIMIPCTNYIVDTYVPVVASAVAANACLRSGFGAAFPMFAGLMFKKVGTGYAGTIVGGLALLLLPVPVIFYRYDEKIRSKSRFAIHL